MNELYTHLNLGSKLIIIITEYSHHFYTYIVLVQFVAAHLLFTFLGPSALLCSRMNVPHFGVGISQIEWKLKLKTEIS